MRAWLAMIGVWTLASVGCGENSTLLPDEEPNWIRVDTLWASGVAVSDTAAVRVAFNQYVNFVETTGGSFPDREADWTFLVARPYDHWRGVFYWQVDHMALCDCSPEPILRRLVYVDEDGVLVLSIGPY